MHTSSKIDVGQERNTPDPLTDSTSIGRVDSTADERQ